MFKLFKEEIIVLYPSVLLLGKEVGAEIRQKERSELIIYAAINMHHLIEHQS